MDPSTSAQDVTRCDLCETAVVQMHCDTCLVNLCKACVGEYISTDETKDHKVVKFQSRRSTPLYPGCRSHDKELCGMYCKKCDIPICSACIVSETHSGHKILQILPVYYAKKKEIEIENEELKESIYPTYQDIASDVQNKMSQLEKEYGDLSTAITKHGDHWHGEIDKIVNKFQAEVNEMKASHHSVLEKHIAEINQRMSDIDDEIEAFCTLIESNDLSQVFKFKGKTTEFRKLPCKMNASIPSFTPRLCQQEQVINLFGKLTTLSITSEEYGYRMKTLQKSQEAGSSPVVKLFLDEPETVTTIDTGYIQGYENKLEKRCTGYLYNVACLSDNEIWTRGDDNTMKLFSISQGSLIKSIRTKSGNIPFGIAVTKSGDLVYTDYNDRTVNIVKNEKIEEVIRLQNWKPDRLCSTFSGDVLVSMDSDDYNQSKVVLYSGSTLKQIIQFDDKGLPLYSSGGYYKYITENRNLDICVAEAGAIVVVVNQAGKLKFRYTGHTPAPKNKPFNPEGITTDSQSHILTADYNNDCVHIIDQDGQFLRYIDCGLSDPWGLCTDTKDNLFVAQLSNGKVKKIKYLQ